jgi:hypothetical protein
MFLSVVILGRFTTETHAMALYISADTPPLLTPHPGTLPWTVERATCVTLRRRSPMFVCDCGQIGGMAWAGGVSTYAASPAPIADLVDVRHG